MNPATSHKSKHFYDSSQKKSTLTIYNFQHQHNSRLLFLIFHSEIISSVHKINNSGDRPTSVTKWNLSSTVLVLDSVSILLYVSVLYF